MTTTPTTWLSAQQANTTDAGAPGDDQTGIQLVGLTNGNFVALWESNTDGGPDNSAGGTDIIGQLYDAQGNAIGGEFRANQGFFADDEGDFTAVALSNGNFVIAYEDTDANGTAIRYNILSATGAVVTTGTIASDPGAQDLGAPAITANSDGSFLVAYQQRDVGVSTATFATIVDNAGVAGSPFLLLAGNLSDDVGAGGQQVATATLSNGNYVIVARQLDGDDGFNMRIVNSTGGNVLGFTEVGTTIGNGQSDVQPSVAAITGGFVVVWQNTDANDTDVVFQRYNLSGVAQGGLVAVNGGPTTDNNVNPSVVGLSDGGFVIVHDDNEAGSIVLQRFSATGSAVGTEVTVDTGGVSPTITLSDDGRLLVGYGTSVFTGGLNFDNDVSVAIFDPRENVFSGDGTSEVITSRQDGADVSGLGGNDTLLGQGAADTLRGGDGDDSIVGGGGSDVIEGGFNADTIQGGSGDDLIFAMTQADVGGSGVSDVIDGDSGNDTLFGSAAGDTLRGGDNDDSIDGGDGADFIEGGFNADTIFGGLGSDVIFAMTQADAQGSGVSDSIDGGDGNDSIVGSAAADTILGGADSDTIDGGGGADTMTGGTGDDFFTVDDVGDKVIEANGAGSGTDTVNSSVTFSLAGQFIERLILTGAGNIDATGNSNANQLTGNSGNNELDGKQGADTMAGAGGSDTYFVDNLGDVVIEANGGGIDTVNSSVSFSLFGQFIEKLTLTGSSNINATGNGLGNKIDGNSGNNKIDGAGGADTMAGGDGNDSYVVNDAGDQVIEANAQGVDKVTSTVTFSLAGQFVENLILDGGADIDGTGNSLGNELTGNSGKNVLNGASGADTLTGGNGQDQFVFANTVQASNVDHLTDYKHGVDKMVLDKSFMSALNVGALTAAEFKNVTTGSVDATDRILYNQTTGELFYDSDGSGSALARLFAVLDNAPTNISNTDFTVVA